MALTPSVRIIKSFNYKGGTRQFSNRYHFSGGTPPDTAHWDALFDAIVAAEENIYSSQTGASVPSVSIVEALGYAAGSDVPVATKSYSQAGTLSVTGGQAAPGAVAALVRYSTDQRTVKNHPVYLFNYYHAAYFTTASGPDHLSTVQSGAMLTYANEWVTGFSDGTTTYHRAGPNGAVALGATVNPFLTHRDFPS